MTAKSLPSRVKRFLTISVHSYSLEETKMKNNAWLLRGFALILLLSLSGCKENYTVVTTLFADGSCDRVVTVTSDSTKVPDVAFPIPVDSSWEISWTAPTKKGEKYLYTARKHFAHVDSLRQEYARASGPGKIKVSIDIEKKFRWFYTYFDYREKYELFKPYTLLPLSQFMTDDEIHRYLEGERSDSLKQKRSMWESRNMFEEYYRGLVDAARALNDPALTPGLIESRKEFLFTELDSSKSDDVVQTTQKVLGTPTVRKIGKELQSLAEQIMNKLTTPSKASGDYVCTVIMPGTILDTNAGEVKGNSIVWKFNDEYLGIADFEMRAESRSVNIWPMAVTGILVLVLIVLPLAVRRRRERQLVAETA
jgi:hypothetical protein